MHEDELVKSTLKTPFSLSSLPRDNCGGSDSASCPLPPGPAAALRWVTGGGRSLTQSRQPRLSQLGMKRSRVNPRQQMRWRVPLNRTTQGPASVFHLPKGPLNLLAHFPLPLALILARPTNRAQEPEALGMSPESRLLQQPCSRACPTPRHGTPPRKASRRLQKALMDQPGAFVSSKDCPLERQHV